MLNSKYIFISLALIFLHTYSASACFERKGLHDTISDSYKIAGTYRYQKCWKVLNPAKNFMRFHIKELHLYTKPVESGNLTIVLKDESKNYTYWSGSKSGDITTTSSIIEIHFKVSAAFFPDNYMANFSLQFEMEVGIIDVKDAQSKAITWLKNHRSPLWDWQESTLKAIIALYLSGNATFDGTNVEEELLVKRAEFYVSRALHRNVISEIDLSFYINFLQVTCNSPRHFSYHDLVQQLLDQLESSRNFTHPSVYLALCNANDKWPQRAVSDLTSILTSRSEYLFFKDIQTFALMAISCKMNQTDSTVSSTKASLLSVYRNSIASLKQRQLPDGSFGNIHETALAIQTLISSGDEFSYDWNSRAAVKYIKNKLNSSEIDFQAVYLSIPLLNRKSLVDIARRNCTGNPRNNEDQMNDFTESKIAVPKDQVRYSLFIGDKKELIRTMTFRIPNNFTAYQVMQLAELQNVKYKFQWRRASGKIYVHEISQIPNDAENGKFWLLFLGSNSGKPPIPIYNKGPDEVVLKHEDHLIMWYKTVKI